MYWHVGQAYACNNNIPLAIRWLKKTAEIEPSWTAYANGTIAFLTKRRKEFEYWAQKEEINKPVFDRLRKHWGKSYFDAYHGPDQDITENTENYGDEEIERYGSELIQRQRNLDFLRSVFGYNNLHRIARALRQGNLKQRLSPAEGDSEYRSRYRRAVRILDAMTDEVGNIIPHSEDARYPKLK